jgi:hypothetical protein
MPGGEQRLRPIRGIGQLRLVGWPGRAIRVDVRGDAASKAFRDRMARTLSTCRRPGPDLPRANTSRNSVASATLGSAFALRLRLQFTWADLKSSSRVRFGSADDRTRRVTGRTQFDREMRSIGFSGGGNSARAHRQHVHHGRDISASVPDGTRASSSSPPLAGRRAFLTLGAASSPSGAARSTRQGRGPPLPTTPCGR